MDVCRGWTVDGQKILNMELPGMSKRGRHQRRLMAVMKKDT